MNSSAPITKTGKASPLDEAAFRFVPSLKFYQVLEQHHRAVLMLRARGASSAEIQDLLKQYSVVVSESAILRFCKKYREEWQRLKVQFEQEGVPLPQVTPSSPLPMSIPNNSNPTLNPTTSGSRTMRDLRGEV